ncbi:MAG: Ku protein [Chloroflexi bacterium]|nr:MAG: Ku protein [Chloroflexota bacterium]
MPQAIWTGAISFGLVSVPVRLYPATRRKDVRFHELDRATGRRIRHQRIRDEAPFQLERPSLEPPSFELPSVEPSPGPRVAYEDVVKGFEVAPRQYVAVSREELEAIAPERSRTIDIEQFVDAAAIDPIAFQTSYYVVPDRDAARSFALLVEAMAGSRRAGVCWIVLRRRGHLAVLRPFQGLMLLTTMFHADEVLPLSQLPPAPAVDLSRKEREMASLLVRTLSGPFEAERYGDEYRQRVKDLIAGKTPVAALPLAASTSSVADLMTALRASVEQVRKRRSRPPARTAARRAGPRRRRRSA